jgi:hypothetical protein
MGLALEGHEVVLADGVEGDVLEDDQLVVFLVEVGLEELGGILPQAAEKFGVHLGDAGGGACEAFTVGVFADGDEDLANGGFDARQIDTAFEGLGAARFIGRCRLFFNA